MKSQPLRTTVIGSYPFPGWLEFTSQRLDQFGPDDVAVTCCITIGKPADTRAGTGSRVA